MSRFTDNGDGTITDYATGLVWEAATRGPMTWQEALDSCAALRLAGHEDWRLPSVRELQSIVDFERFRPACDSVFKAHADFHWSSTAYQGNPSFAWYVSFNDGYTYANFKTYYFFVRAVRGGTGFFAPKEV